METKNTCYTYFYVAGKIAFLEFVQKLNLPVNCISLINNKVENIEICNQTYFQLTEILDRKIIFADSEITIREFINELTFTTKDYDLYNCRLYKDWDIFKDEFNDGIHNYDEYPLCSQLLTSKTFYELIERLMKSKRTKIINFDQKSYLDFKYLLYSASDYIIDYGIKIYNLSNIKYSEIKEINLYDTSSATFDSNFFDDELEYILNDDCIFCFSLFMLHEKIYLCVFNGVVLG